MKRIVSVVAVAALVGAGVWGDFYAQSRGNSPKYRTVRLERGPLAAAEGKANTAKAQVAVVDAQRALSRNKELFGKNLIAKSDEDSSQALYDSSVALLDAAKAKEQALQAGIQSMAAQLRVAEAMYA